MNHCCVRRSELPKRPFFSTHIADGTTRCACRVDGGGEAAEKMRKMAGVERLNTWRAGGGRAGAPAAVDSVGRKRGGAVVAGARTSGPQDVFLQPGVPQVVQPMAINSRSRHPLLCRW